MITGICHNTESPAVHKSTAGDSTILPPYQIATVK